MFLQAFRFPRILENGKHPCWGSFGYSHHRLPIQVRDEPDYGFMLKDNPHEYVYCPSLRCRESDTLKTRLCILQAVREELARDKGRVEQSVECDLDGHYRPVNIRKHYATADLRRPVMVWLHVV